MTPADAQLIELGANENPLGPSPRVRHAIVRKLDHLHRYPPRDEQLRAALAASHGRGLTSGHFVTAASGSGIIEDEQFLDAFAETLGRPRVRSAAR